MESGKKKCSMLIMRNKKRQMTEGMELPNNEKSEEKETYKYLGILEANTIKQAMKKKLSVTGERKNTRTQTIEQKPHQMDKHLGCPPRKWTREELQRMDQRTSN